MSKNGKQQYPNGYWNNRENRENASKKCSNRMEFKEKYSGAYNKSRINGELNDFFDKKTHNDFFWEDFKKCEDVSKKCKSRSDFSFKYKSAYYYSTKNNWLDIFFPLEFIKDVSKMECIKLIENYNTHKEFRTENPSLYKKICNNGWNDILENKFNYKTPKPKGYWNIENSKMESLKYKTKKEFIKKSPSCYNNSIKYGWIDDISKHFIPTGNIKKRGIYCFEFEDTKTCYVGLTYNFEKRENQHLSKGPVFKYIKKYKIPYVFKKITEYVDISDAINYECEYIEKYKSDGWVLLNSVKGGGVGNTQVTKYTFDYCKTISIKYNSRISFYKGDYNTYQHSKKNGWLDDICCHMTTKKTITFEHCKKIASECVYLSVFTKKYPTLYDKSNKKGWLNHFNLIRVKNDVKKGFWNSFDNCLNASKTCELKKDFGKKYPSAYSYSKKNGWLDIFYPIVEKMVNVYDINHIFIKQYKNKHIMCKKLDISPRQAYYVLKGERNSYHGYRLKYVN